VSVPERETTPMWPALWMWPGMMPILQPTPGVMMPGQFGADEARLAAWSLEHAPHLDHVHHRDALGDAHDEREPASNASRIASAAPGGGTKMQLALAPVSFTACDGVEHGDLALELLAAARPA
jgi:hypothetical protein